MSLFLFSMLLPAEPKEWIQLCQTGRWDGYRSGSVVLTDQDLHDMAANFARDPRGRVVIDYEHQTLHAQENGKPAPASGWITAVEVRLVPGAPTQLWGKPTWTLSGDTHIRSQEYSYVSPVIVFRSRDRVTGKPEGSRLHSVALTNQPFFTELPAVAAKELALEPSMFHLLLACMGLPTETAEDVVVDRVKAMSEGRKRACASLGLPPEAADADVATAFSEIGRRAEIGAAVCNELQIADTVSAADAIAKVKPVLGHAGYVAASAHQVVAAELADLKAGHAVDAAITAGKITPATEGWARGEAKRDLAGFQRWVAMTSPVIPPPVVIAPGPRPSADGKLSAEELAVCTQLGLTAEQYVKVKAL